MQLKELLIQYEIQNDLSHLDVANKVGVSLSTYYRWINGESTKLKRNTIERLSNVLECDIDSIIEETNRIKPILGKADAQKGDYFLRVKGDSMEGSHIYDGDLLYVQICSEVPSGSIAVVLIGDEATVKKVKYKNDLMILEASNPKYEARYFTAQEVETIPVRIIGIVRFVRTDFI